MLKTQQSKSLRTAYVSKPFVLLGSAHSFLPCGSVFYLTLTSCAMYEFSLAWSLAVEVKFTEEVSGFR